MSTNVPKLPKGVAGPGLWLRLTFKDQTRLPEFATTPENSILNLADVKTFRLLSTLGEGYFDVSREDLLHVEVLGVIGGQNYLKGIQYPAVTS